MAKRTDKYYFHIKWRDSKIAGTATWQLMKEPENEILAESHQEFSTYEDIECHIFYFAHLMNIENFKIISH